MNVNPFPRSLAFYDKEWASRLIGRCDDVIAYLRGDLLPNGRLFTRKGRNKGITFVTDATYAAGEADEVLDVNRAGAVTITLLEAPEVGYTLFIYDASDAASTNNITIDTTGATTINGGNSVVINADAGAYQIIFNGTEYRAFDV